MLNFALKSFFYGPSAFSIDSRNSKIFYLFESQPSPEPDAGVVLWISGASGPASVTTPPRSRTACCEPRAHPMRTQDTDTSYQSICW